MYQLRIFLRLLEEFVDFVQVKKALVLVVMALVSLLHQRKVLAHKEGDTDLTSVIKFKFIDLNRHPLMMTDNARLLNMVS